jgi:uncharacterized protein YndB with AHSA1/START domain
MVPILLALAVIALLFGVVVAGRPDEFAISRSTTIAAPPEDVFPRVNELRKWEDWSPWAKLDPTARSTFDGAAAGVGAEMSWDGNKKVGAGRMTIVESNPFERVRIKLDFLRPFQATNLAEFQFKPDGGQTVVAWTMTGQNNFFFKVFGLLMNFDDMVGKDFEKGLASLKAVVEGPQLLTPTRRAN